MKRRNIAFSGFMAAILLGAGAANAATTQIASRQYVDAAVDEIQTDVDALDAVVNDPESGLAAQVKGAVDKADAASSAVEQLGTDVGALKTTVGDEADGLVKDVDDLQGQVGALDTELDSKLDSATADGKYEVLTNKATEINVGNQSSPSAYPSVGAIVQWTNQKIADLSDTGLPVNPGNINDNSIAGSKLANGAVTTDKIANDAVNGDKIADDSIGAEHIADGAVGSDAIADGAVGNADLAADSVTTDKIKDGTISSADLDTALNAEIDGKEDKTRHPQTHIRLSRRCTIGPRPRLQMLSLIHRLIWGPGLYLGIRLPMAQLPAIKLPMMRLILMRLPIMRLEQIKSPMARSRPISWILR